MPLFSTDTAKLVGLVPSWVFTGCVFLWVRALVGQFFCSLVKTCIFVGRIFFSGGSKSFPVGLDFLVRRICFSWVQCFFSWVENLTSDLFSCVICLPKVKILFTWNNPGYFETPWSDQGVRKVTYLLKLVKLEVLVRKKLKMLSNHGK